MNPRLSVFVAKSQTAEHSENAAFAHARKRGAGLAQGAQRPAGLVDAVLSRRLAQVRQNLFFVHVRPAAAPFGDRESLDALTGCRLEVDKRQVEPTVDCEELFFLVMSEGNRDFNAFIGVLNMSFNPTRKTAR